MAVAQHRHLADAIAFQQLYGVSNRVFGADADDKWHTACVRAPVGEDIVQCGLLSFRLHEQVVLAHPGIVKLLAQVAAPGIGEQHNYHILRRQAARVDQSGPQRGTGRTSDQDALFPRQPPRPVEGGTIIDANYLIDHGGVIVFREKLHADALNLIRAGYITGVDGSGRVSADDFNVRILLFEITRGAADGAAGADTGDEGRDAPVGIAPDLRAGRGIVRGRISRIGILVRTDRARNLIGQSVRHIFVVFRRIVGDTAGADNHFSAIGAQQAAFLLADFIGHDKDTVVALLRGSQRQPMPGIATGRLYNRPART